MLWLLWRVCGVGGRALMVLQIYYVACTEDAVGPACGNRRLREYLHQVSVLA